ncbi:hypothetical protein AWH56_022420 [Anaerobacillus isosaccharinicus]|uniref:Uncharacterized protein n=1 Tax=Anaerobacillus isosaccharinicus TaxID=1532552 RepID=A0A1S2L6I5_9BACI|nr:hypothetical protein [Anaerobacillus isosaccharinicus]MBA5586342.1 hypothetical protein [Anaerobacillus isosaccharinicus]QOY35409.1 hypothetical protein AWH56_022420 [Anaerobacillus isosaccharinicus]
MEDILKQILSKLDNLEIGQGELANGQKALEKGQRGLLNRQEALEKGQQGLLNRQEALEKGQQSVNGHIIPDSHFHFNPGENLK